ncbi:hypothetical protein Dgeo_2939 (plasmid) [Deinococcus geothermalis DSM 11300]|uniref:Uncharacterized protein n=1 Tax=Deinococcus geothermalis (strain DSM 11300 / CIP 105573 / AG-3a) TaxID=319795 RepID=A8ZR73_DEIGD|nr:hypothetical protein [Deinococcus geothermalis]ABW34982.1 hypothetical protein Dgeo_2939 [Deinococcus geothermalis DSM 11300]
MLTLQMHRALATVVKSYAQQFLQPDLQHVTALNAAAQLLGYRDYRQARGGMLGGDKPHLAETVRGRTYIARARDVLTHLYAQSGREAPGPVEAAGFAQQVMVDHDLALWELLGAGPVLRELVQEGRSTLVADPRPWVSAPLQRALIHALGDRYALQFGTIDHRRFYTVVDSRQLYAAGPPVGIRTFQGAEFWFQDGIPNIFFQARVDHTTERLALPPLTPEIEAQYDPYIMRTCASVHAVYMLPPQQAATAWRALCGPHPVRGGFALLGVDDTRLTLEWCVTR